MKKWFRRLLLYPFIIIIVGLVVLLAINPNLFHLTKSFYGSQLQWYGYDDTGGQIVDLSLSKLSKESAELYHLYSIQNTKNGNYDEAIKYLNRAAELAPMNVDGYYGWCLLYYYRDYDKALFYLNRLDDATDYVDYVGDDNILYAKALCYKQKGEYAMALKLLQDVIQYELDTHSDSWITHQMYFQTARTFHLMAKYEEAIQYYDKAIAKWDGSSESFYYKGIAQIKNGNIKGCKNIKMANQMVSQGLKSSDSYVQLFDEIYPEQVQNTFTLLCEQKQTK